MSIRFHCTRCHQLLGIASRKAGSEIACPKCGLSQVVPSEDAAAAALAMGQFAKSAQPITADENLVVYEDEPSVIETPRRRSPPPMTASPMSEAEAGPHEAVPSGMILYPRRALYLQALLFLALGVTAFATGYFVGRGDANYQQQIQQQEAARLRVPVRGRVIYSHQNQPALADENAVVILLPEAKLPDRKLSFRDIRPGDPMPADPPRTVRLIRELGGEYGRTDAQGEFFLVVPDQGTYRLLIISNHADREKATEIDEVEEEEMKSYFDLPELLIERRRYRWTKEEINVGFNSVEVRFDD